MSKTITINGVHYDAHSGIATSEAPDTAAKASSKGSGSHAQSVHARTQRSHTLHRGAAKSSAPVAPARKPVHARSPHITKFARDPQPIKQPHVVTVNDIGPAVHPHVAKAHTKAAAPAAHKHTASRPAVHVPAREVKQQAISAALAQAAPAKHKRAKKSLRPGGRLVNVATASLAIALLAGYLTYLNLPALSVRVAAAQAGINASYPDYRPSGYSLDGPIAYSGGEVSMNFKSNSNSQRFALNQAKSSWDSSALLTNYIEQKSAGNYTTYSDAGLTIYTYGSNAAWVNGGILYTIEGDAPLSDTQVRHIATSL